MSEPFVGQIVMFGGNFAPRGWALCEGQLLAVSQNDALFSLLGTIYGGDGRTTFGLPDLRGRAPMHAGSGPGLSNRRLGAKLGTENNTLNLNQLPNHTHTSSTNVTLTPRSAGAATTTDPAGAYPANSSNYQGTSNLYSDTADTSLKPGTMNLDTTLGNTGGSQPINNMAPYQTVNFIIALVGIYPSRS